MNVLQSFQERLQVVSKKNRSLFLRKIIAKKTFDIANLSQFSKQKVSDVMQKVLKKQGKITLCSIRGSNKKEEIVAKQLMQLKRDIDALYFEKGIRECYIGYPFVQGHFHDKTEFHCPLLLYPVEISIDSKTQKIELEATRKPIINETFFLAFNKFSNRRAFIQKEQLEQLSELPGEELYDATIKLFKLLDITVTTPISLDVKPFEEYTLNTKIEQDESRIAIKPYCVLGQFLQSQSSISNDYDNILQHTLKNELVDILLGNTVSPQQTYDTVKESDLHTISILDSSQEEVVKVAKKAKGLVIHGPPGTGKSQVITNIISDKLHAKKKILMVCEKRAALDVVANRLKAKGLDKHTLLIHDSLTDRNMLFEKIAKDIESYEQLKKKDMSQLESIHGELDKLLNDLETIHTLFHTKHKKVGLTPFEIYSRASHNEKFIVVSKKLLRSYSLEKLKRFCESITSIASTAYELQDEQNPFTEKKKSFSSLSEVTFRQKIQELEELAQSVEKTLSTKSFDEDFEHLPKKYKTIMFTGKQLKLYNTQKDSFIRFCNPYWFYVAKKYAKIIREQHLSETTKRWCDIQPKLTQLYDCLKFFSPYIDEKLFTLIKKHIVERKSISTFIKQIKEYGENISAYKKHDALVYSFSKHQKQVYDSCLKQIPQTKTLIDDWTKCIYNSFYIGWAQLLEEKYTALSQFTLESYKQKQKYITQLLEQKTQLIPSSVTNQYIDLFETFSQNTPDKTNSISLMYREVTKKRNRLTIRQFFEKFGTNGLFELYPCILCSPETASEILELKQLFNTLIFDEASQIRIEKAIPAMLRSNQLIVAGDEKQLPPTSFFQTHSDDELDYDFSEEEKSLLEDESLLIRAKTVFESKRLTYHYRSIWPELIEFSNKSFYNGSLKIIQPPLMSQQPIEYVQVKGVWFNQQNRKEAAAVVDILRKELTKNTKQTFGIITFNAKQKELIEELLLEELKKNTQFSKTLSSELERVEDGEFVGLFVKNIENVQGDERDVILFSLGYGFDSNRVFRYNFGPLNGMYGPNRLNVAISRAKEKMFICASIHPKDFAYKGSMLGPKLLQEFLSYSYDISSKKASTDEAKQESTQSINSEFEKRIITDLEKNSHSFQSHVGNAEFSITAALVEKKRFVKGFIALSNTSESVKEFDILKPYILSHKKWDVQTLYPNHWFNEQSNILKIPSKK